MMMDLIVHFLIIPCDFGLVLTRFRDFLRHFWQCRPKLNTKNLRNSEPCQTTVYQGKKNNNNNIWHLSHKSKQWYYPLRMLITLVWAVAISASRACFLSKWRSLWGRLRCQFEPWLRRSPPFTVPQPDLRRGREECDGLTLSECPGLPSCLTPSAQHPWASVSATVSPVTSSQFHKYVLDMAGMSYADVPVAGDKFESKEMSGWRQLWSYNFTRCLPLLTFSRHELATPWTYFTCTVNIFSTRSLWEAQSRMWLSRLTWPVAFRSMTYKILKHVPMRRSPLKRITAGAGAVTDGK